MSAVQDFSVPARSVVQDHVLLLPFTPLSCPPSCLGAWSLSAPGEEGPSVALSSLYHFRPSERGSHLPRSAPLHPTVSFTSSPPTASRPSSWRKGKQGRPPIAGHHPGQASTGTPPSWGSSLGHVRPAPGFCWQCFLKIGICYEQIEELHVNFISELFLKKQNGNTRSTARRGRCRLELSADPWSLRPSPSFGGAHADSLPLVAPRPLSRVPASNW